MNTYRPIPTLYYCSKRTILRSLNYLKLPTVKSLSVGFYVGLFYKIEDRKMTTCANNNSQYEQAVSALNSLQSNSETLEKIRGLGLRRDKNCQSLKITQNYLERLGLNLNDLDKLNIIHVSGTKGKGSTCAFTECLLREHGFKTGFFSSPHLVAVRERIRINGLPISKEEFSSSFWNVFNKLSSLKENDGDMPAYFKFLTILAFYIFLKEEVDVAIMEVGIGGEYDCTNVIRNPVVCGITSLDYDHISILGTTIEEIAWHKAGIIKSGVSAFTVPQQPIQALKVLLERAKQKDSVLRVVPSLESYGWGGKPIQLGLNGFAQLLNCSLALQLSRYWLSLKGGSKKIINETIGQPFELSEGEMSCLSNIVWPGRSQVLDTDFATFFLDGAHTFSSIKNCVEWFNKVSWQHINKKLGNNAHKVLVFNLTGDRDCKAMLELLHPCKFDLIIFTTNLVDKQMTASSDQRNYTVSEASQIERCQKLKNIWDQLECSSLESNRNYPMDAAASSSTDSKINFDELSISHIKVEAEAVKDTKSSSKTFHCISEVLTFLAGNSIRNSESNSEVESYLQLPSTVGQVHVLVTGSLHLVGGFLSILDPNLSLSSKSQCSSKQSIEDFVRRK